MAAEITDLTVEGKKYFAELRKLEKLEVRVGFQRDQTYEDGSSLVDIAAYNEFGTSRIPARPFMKQSFENHEDELQAACNEANKAISNGGTAESALNKLGVTVKGIVQQEIVDGGFAPNAERTIKQKGSEQPLIDTGHMRQSVNYVVKTRNSG